MEVRDGAPGIYRERKLEDPEESGLTLTLPPWLQLGIRSRGNSAIKQTSSVACSSYYYRHSEIG